MSKPKKLEANKEQESPSNKFVDYHTKVFNFRKKKDSDSSTEHFAQ